MKKSRFTETQFFKILKEQEHRSLFYYHPHPKTDRDAEIGPILAQWAGQFPYYGFRML